MTRIGTIVLLLSALIAPPSSAQSDRWDGLRFLLGAWEGTSTGQPGDGTVRREYRLVLRDQFMEVRGTSTYPAQERNPNGEVHEELGYFSYDRARDSFVFRQFHVETFVVTYASSMRGVGPAAAVFTSEAIENIPAGWRARESYRAVGPDEIVETFELAEPGKDFAVYTETRLRRVR
jgi:hypothetical protein